MFKREKEISRKLEFDGLYISVQPSDEDLQGQWDRLVISCPSFPLTYWDKFIKKKVVEKFGTQFDKDKVSNLLGLDTTINMNISPKQRQEQERDSYADISLLKAFSDGRLIHDTSHESLK